MATLLALEPMRPVTQTLNVDLFQLKVAVKLPFGCNVKQEKGIRPPLHMLAASTQYGVWSAVARIIIPNDRKFMARH